jgi:putative flippase GtrA
LLPSREKWLFALVGVSVAVFGRVLLDLLIAVGCAAALANVLQAVVTLQVNFAGNRVLTWRRRVAGSGVALWRRWGRFHVARGAGLLLCVALFPVVAPVAGRTVAYWACSGPPPG